MHCNLVERDHFRGAGWSSRWTEVAASSNMLETIYRTTWHHIPQGCNLHINKKFWTK